jgi:transcriptional regulator with XRE-family HTH domain
MKDRIIKFLTHENITATRFADEIGVQRSSVSHILSGRNNPSFEFIQKILMRYKSLSADWLLVGTGSMYKKAEQMNLFASPVGTTTNTKQHEENKSVIEKLSPPEGDKIPLPVPEVEISPFRKIEKILIFYSDKTFEEFQSQNNS